MGARRVDPVSVEVLDSTLAEQPVALLHFVCHGKEVPEEAEQVLFLEEREGALEELSVTMAKGLRGLKEILDRGRPLVFLNACELAGQVPALVSARGFAPAFLGLGARAVVAALWSVDDGVAFRVAVRFYRKLVRDPLARPAEVLRELRARAYGGATAGVDSYAAYCFYGDPLARRAG
jgi:CHAT domain-containing protein